MILVKSIILHFVQELFVFFILPFLILIYYHIVIITFILYIIFTFCWPISTVFLFLFYLFIYLFIYYIIILLLQPAFQVADNLRCLKSKNMLKTIVDDTSISVQKLTKNQIQSSLLRQEIPLLEVSFFLALHTLLFCIFLSLF